MSYPFTEWEPKKKKRMILYSHMTNGHMISKDTPTNPREDNYSLSP